LFSINPIKRYTPEPIPDFSVLTVFCSLVKGLLLHIFHCDYSGQSSHLFRRKVIHKIFKEDFDEVIKIYSSLIQIYDDGLATDSGDISTDSKALKVEEAPRLTLQP